MSNTYTSILKLAKPATGDAGWGATINDKVTTLIEEAISGKAGINTWGQGGDSANVHTLTINEGASSESRNAVLSLTDTSTQLSGAGTVVVPTASKLYTVINVTGQTITVKTASGTGIAVPTAQQINLMCDGTNVVEQNNYSAAIQAAIARIDSLRLASSGATVDSIITDCFGSNTDTKVATNKAVRTLVGTIGNFKRSERIYPWGSSDSASIAGVTPPSIFVDEGDTETVATFDLYGNGNTVFQELDLAISGILARTGTHTNPVLASVILRVQRKSAGATGTSIGAVTDADAKQGGSSSYWYLIKVAGDQTNKIDSFSYLDDAADGASKKRIQNATYDDATNKTTIVYDNGSEGTGLFSSTGGTVYVSSSAFESVGTWVTASPFIPDSGVAESFDSTYTISEYLPINGSGSALLVRKQNNLPTLKLVPDSGGAGNVEMRVQVGAGLSSSDGQYTFNVLQVDQTNVTRP
jgi:hypothetical protein